MSDCDLQRNFFVYKKEAKTKKYKKNLCYFTLRYDDGVFLNMLQKFVIKCIELGHDHTAAKNIYNIILYISSCSKRKTRHIMPLF